MIDDTDDSGGAEGRTMGDAPEIDGKVLLRDSYGIQPGDVVNVEIEDADDYDLYGVAIK